MYGSLWFHGETICSVGPSNLVSISLVVIIASQSRLARQPSLLCQLPLKHGLELENVIRLQKVCAVALGQRPHEAAFQGGETPTAPMQRLERLGHFGGWPSANISPIGLSPWKIKNVGKDNKQMRIVWLMTTGQWVRTNLQVRY